YLASGDAGTPKTEWLEALLKVCMDLHLEKKAFKVIQSLVDKNEDDPRWWKILAQFHLQQGDYKKAVAALKIHSYLVPIKKQDIILMGDLYNAIEVPVKAAEYYEKAVKFEKDRSAYEKLAAAYIAAHKPDKALNVLNQALEEKSTSGLWFMMGRIRYEKEEFDKAYNAFKKSAQMDPKDGRAYLMMGYCALQIHKKDAARMAFQKATKFRDQRKRAKELLKELASL
ncbi:MAG: tetratricopeptide repeat protein, partial [Deltaproteobacteria bacterium]|nr:tetratricopeptide repeat protein [Deltaproteobacteria bacterium]